MATFQPRDPHVAERVAASFQWQTVMATLGAALRQVAPRFRWDASTYNDLPEEPSWPEGAGQGRVLTLANGRRSRPMPGAIMSAPPPMW